MEAQNGIRFALNPTLDLNLRANRMEMSRRLYLVSDPTLGIRQTRARQSRNVSGKVGEVLSRLIEERALGHEMIFRGRVT